MASVMSRRGGSSSDAAWAALAPMAGQDVWHDMMRVYARHLEQCGDQRMAALYHLALGDVFEAVQVYARAGRFREAILLARVRLGVSYVGHRYFSSRACERRICAGESWLVRRVAWRFGIVC